MSKKKQSCILHLGAAKTGTTALQFGLAKYDDGETVYARIPTAPDNPNQSEPLVYAGLSTQDVQARAETYPQWRDDGDRMKRPNIAVMTYMLREGIPPDPQTYQDALAASISAVPHQRVIYSGELLLSNYDAAKGLISFLKTHFSKIEAICYFRPCASAILSRFQQRLTAPNPLVFFAEGMRQDLNQLTFKDADYFAHWKEALSDENLQAAIYSQRVLKNGDVVDDFCERMQLDAYQARRTRTNVSFSAEATAVLATLSYYGNAPSGSVSFGRNKRYFDVLMSQFGKGKLGLSDAFAERLHNANAEALDYVDRECGQAFVRDFDRGSHTIDKHEDLLAICQEILPELTDFLAIQAGERFGKLPRDADAFARALCQILCEPDAFPERRLPTRFNAAQYLVFNPDIARAQVDPKQHFLDHGCFEGRFY